MDKKNILEAHYREYYKTLVKRMSYRVGNDMALAEDVVQEGYARALRYLNGYKTDQDFGGWFNSVLLSSLRNIQNAERNKGVVHAEMHVEHNGDAAITKNSLLSLMKGESKRNQIILSHFYLDGITTREIAQYLDLKHSTVRQVIHRFGKKFIAAADGVG